MANLDISRDGVNGGYVLSAAHCLQSDVPDADIAAMFQAGKDRARLT